MGIYMTSQKRCVLVPDEVDQNVAYEKQQDEIQKFGAECEKIHQNPGSQNFLQPIFPQIMKILQLLERNHLAETTRELVTHVKNLSITLPNQTTHLLMP